MSLWTILRDYSQHYQRLPTKMKTETPESPAIRKLTAEMEDWRDRARRAEAELKKYENDMDGLLKSYEDLQPMAQSMIIVFQDLEKLSKTLPPSTAGAVADCLERLKAIKPKGTP